MSAGRSATCRHGAMCISLRGPSVLGGWGNKDVLGLTCGFRESTQSWRELRLDLKRRGLEAAPKLAVGDGAMGFWAALHEVYGKTRVQRCWVHKTANVLNAMPKSVQPKAKAHLKDI